MQQITRLLFIVGLFVILCASGCRRQSPRGSISQWIPQHVGGPLEVRPLPPAKQLASHYEEWVASDPSDKVRLYEVTVGPTNRQLEFSVRHGEGKIPMMGMRTSTMADFILSNEVSGEYFLRWHSSGKKSADFLRVPAGQLKQMWLKVGIPVSDYPPELDIVAVEGAKPSRMLVATDGGLGTVPSPARGGADGAGETSR